MRVKKVIRFRPPVPSPRSRRTAFAVAAGFVVCVAAGTVLCLSGGPAVTATPAASMPEAQDFRASTGALLVTMPWGDGPGQVGIVRPAEGLSRGPEALAVAADGRIAVLDSVNKRVVCLDAAGNFLSAFPLPLAEPRFVAVDSTAIYALDCDTDRALVTLSWQGEIVAIVTLPELPDVVTGLFATEPGPSVEVARDQVYLVSALGSSRTGAGEAELGADLPTDLATGLLAQAGKSFSDRGNAPARKRGLLRSVPGRPVDPGLKRVVKAYYKPQTGLELRAIQVDPSSLAAERETTLRPVLARGQRIEHLVSIDQDPRGGLIIGARLLDAGSRTDGRPALAVTRLSAAQLADTGSAAAYSQVIFLADLSSAYVGQPYVIDPAGRVLQPVAGEEGYSIFVHEFPESSFSEQEVAQ